MQNKTISATIWILCLTIAAYVLAQTAVVLLSGSFDASSKSPAAVPQIRTESKAPIPRRHAHAPATTVVRDVKVERISDTNWVLDKASLLANTRDMNRFLSQARLVPARKQGWTLGYRIINITPGSFFEQIGLQNGDVLIRVNGRFLDGPAALRVLYREMKGQNHIALRLYRNGRYQTFHYDVR